MVVLAAISDLLFLNVHLFYYSIKVKWAKNTYVNQAAARFPHDALVVKPTHDAHLSRKAVRMTPSRLGKPFAHDAKGQT